MRIDAHQHFWKYDPQEYAWISDDMPRLKKDCLPPDLQPELEAKGFDGCVAVQARQSEAETDFLLELSNRYAFVKSVVGWVDFCDDQVGRRLEYYRQFGRLSGFRHIVQDEADDRFLLREDFRRGVALLADFDFTYDILVYEKHLPVVVEFLEKMPAQPFVLDHIGKPVIAGGMSEAWASGIRAIAGYPHVYCKLSGLVTEADWRHWSADDFRPFLEVVLEAFGPKRLMIGSDWPVCLLAADNYGQVIDIVDAFTRELPAHERAAIYGGNAAEFYQIS